MQISLEFIIIFSISLFHVGPFLLGQLLFILVLGLLTGRSEQWSTGEAVYWSLITATTVGYGDIHPTTKTGRICSILISLVGLIMTGIIVAIAIQAAGTAFEHLHPGTHL